MFEDHFGMNDKMPEKNKDLESLGSNLWYSKYAEQKERADKFEADVHYWKMSLASEHLEKRDKLNNLYSENKVLKSVVQTLESEAENVAQDLKKKDEIINRLSVLSHTKSSEVSYREHLLRENNQFLIKENTQLRSRINQIFILAKEKPNQ